MVKFYLQGNKRVLLISLTIFIIVKVFLIPFSTPLWWDEAWAYGRTIDYLINHDITFLPNSAPDSFSRGHPLLIHSIVAFLLQYLGQNSFSIHLIIFAINLFSVIAIWLFLKEFIKSEIFLLLSLLLIILQPAFITQSGMLLVEVPLIGLFFYSIYFYYNNKYFVSTLMLSFSLLVKETAIIFVMPLLFLILYRSYKVRNNIGHFFKISAVNLSPLLSPILYYFLQFILKGYLLFPEHTANTSFDIQTIFEKLTGFSANCFIYQGRNVYLIGFILSLIYAYFNRKLYLEHILILIFSIMIIYILISSFNFYSPRYVLLSLVTFVCIVLILIYRIFSEQKYIVYFFYFIFFVSTSINLVKKKSHSDINPFFTFAANLTKQFLLNIEEVDSLKGKIEYSFLLDNYRRSEILGYVSGIQNYQQDEKLVYKATEVIGKAEDSMEINLIYKIEIPNYKCILVKK